MKAEQFVEGIKELGITTLVGVPDSTLKQFCDYINTDGKDEFHHYVPENEGAAVGIAAGVYLATNKPVCIYMQNSGLGNTVNPVTSLINKEVYDIPMLMLIGWRGEPGVHDEPQHKFMGRITKELLDVLDISYEVIGEETTESEVEKVFARASRALEKNCQYAIIIKKNTFEERKGEGYRNENSLCREEVIGQILKVLNKEDIVVSTTGKISREVYEQSDKILGQHSQEFLTVGGMGYASMIAFGMAKNVPQKRVVCIDGDGAVLMHMGSLPFIGKENPKNLLHFCLNNEAHESVGGMPTGASGQSYAEIARASGYKKIFCVENDEELNVMLESLEGIEGPVFAEVKVSMDSRKNLGRPKETAVENKELFMKYHEVI